MRPTHIIITSHKIDEYKTLYTVGHYIIITYNML